jgi:hypothetical protein
VDDDGRDDTTARGARFVARADTFSLVRFDPPPVR